MGIHLGDCIEVMRTFAPDSIDAIVTDPPYGWRFMGKAWDKFDIDEMAARDTAGQKWTTRPNGNPRAPRKKTSEAAGTYDFSLTGNQAFQVFTEGWAKEAFRVLKPGGHMLVFCGPRTYHRMASGVEDAGFEIRDQLQWLFGQGFPKSLDISKAIDKAAGEAQTDIAKQWQGWGTALKPANEPIVLARKPLEKGLTVAQNVQKWGTGGINIDSCRITPIEGDPNNRKNRGLGRSSGGYKPDQEVYGTAKETLKEIHQHQGRFPANLILDETAAAMLDEQTGILSAAGNVRESNITEGESVFGIGGIGKRNPKISGDKPGGASRFFYCAKTSTSERNRGLEDSKNVHPTVKPIKLMEYLCKLITPPGGIVLDPFMGSGSTGCAAKNLGFAFEGIEVNSEYWEIAKRRIEL